MHRAGPKLAIDATFLIPGKVGGAEYMLKNLITGLMEIGALSNFVLYGDISLAAELGIDDEDMAPVPGTNRFLRSIRIALASRSYQDAVLYPNYFSPPRLFSGHLRVVTVIHDLLYRHHPQVFSARKRAWLRLSHEMALRTSDRVVAISEFTRQDILEAYGAKWAKKVVTIHNPISWARFEKAKPVPNNGSLAHPIALRSLGRPVTLTIAAHYEHKNLPTLIAAHRRLRLRAGFEQATLLIAGQLRENLVGIKKQTTNESSQFDGEGIRVLGYVDDATLAAALKTADIFAFPSIFEGFGMPAVEALGLGLPIVTTRHASLPEVTLGLARYVDDALSVEQWAQALEEVGDNLEVWRPSEEAIKRLRDMYSPSHIASKYLEVLKPPS